MKDRSSSSGVASLLSLFGAITSSPVEPLAAPAPIRTEHRHNLLLHRRRSRWVTEASTLVAGDVHDGHAVPQRREALGHVAHELVALGLGRKAAAVEQEARLR